MHHFRKTRRTYNSHNSNDTKRAVTCSLCPTLQGGSIIDQTDTMFIIPNRVPYDMFEGKRTTGEHYMILPKRHVESIQDFTDQEKLEMMSLAGKYESLGFSVYARGVGSITRSQKHQHTHLIKLDTTPTRLLLYLNKPYFVFHR